MQPSGTAYQITQSSQAMRPLNKEICSHWDSVSLSCRQIKDGLFLPIEQHVITYCQSNHYPLCPHYQLLSADQSEVRKDAVPLCDRRRSNRLPCHHIVHFSEISNCNPRMNRRSDDAWTIDLSEHGIRLATRQLLPKDSTLSFILIAGETMTSIEGTGRVIWAEHFKNTTLFHAGIDFTSTLSSLPPPPCT